MSTSESDHELALLGLWHGAAGIVPSSATPDAMRRLLDATIRGEAVASRRLVLRLIEQLRASGAYHVAPAGRPLSPREREVLDLLERGCTTAEIAGGLGVAQGTVRTHVKHIRDKLGPEPLPA
jgi:DNA-binding NarL/FixJ family response regulator